MKTRSAYTRPNDKGSPGPGSGPAGVSAYENASSQATSAATLRCSLTALFWCPAGVGMGQGKMPLLRALRGSEDARRRQTSPNGKAIIWAVTLPQPPSPAGSAPWSHTTCRPSPC